MLDRAQPTRAAQEVARLYQTLRLGQGQDPKLDELAGAYTTESQKLSSLYDARDHELRDSSTQAAEAWRLFETERGASLARTIARPVRHGRRWLVGGLAAALAVAISVAVVAPYLIPPPPTTLDSRGPHKRIGYGEAATAEDAVIANTVQGLTLDVFPAMIDKFTRDPSDRGIRFPLGRFVMIDIAMGAANTPAERPSEAMKAKWLQQYKAEQAQNLGGVEPEYNFELLDMYAITQLDPVRIYRSRDAYNLRIGQRLSEFAEYSLYSYSRSPQLVDGSRKLSPEAGQFLISYQPIEIAQVNSRIYQNLQVTFKSYA